MTSTPDLEESKVDESPNGEIQLLPYIASTTAGTTPVSEVSTQDITADNSPLSLPASSTPKSQSLVHVCSV